MRNRLLHDVLRDFALEAAALLTDDLRDGAEIEFDVTSEGGGRGPSLYRYQPRTRAFLDERWPRLRALPACGRAAAELGAGASTWLRVNGLRGEQAEPALRAMLERMYEDATSFGFPEERFERLYREVEETLYSGTARARLVVPLGGVQIAAARVDLGGGLSLMRAELADSPPEAGWTGEHDPPAVLCVLERDTPADEPISALEAEERFAAVVGALRLWAPGAVWLASPGWRRADEGPWQPVSLAGGSARGDAPGWFLPAGHEAAFAEFFAALEEARPGSTVAWARARFEMGCERAREHEALSDYLLALRALLDATSDDGEATLALRVAALCAEEGSRRTVQRRVEEALALERFVMGGGPGMRPDGEPPRELVAGLEGHLRALLRDVLCGYLDADLKSVADDILLETNSEPFMDIRARDLRAETEPDTAELDAVEPEPEPEPEPEHAPEVAPEPQRFARRQPEPLDDEELEVPQWSLHGVTESSDWGWDDYSAPV
jgi:hypothetical protein